MAQGGRTLHATLDALRGRPPAAFHVLFHLLSYLGTPPGLARRPPPAGQRGRPRVSRLRAFSLDLQRRLVQALAGRGVEATGGTEDRGAFLIVVDERAEAWSDALGHRGVVTDARGRFLRLCPDLLTTEDEIAAAAEAVAATRPRSG